MGLLGTGLASSLPVAQAQGNASEQPSLLTEVVVTATKRAEDPITVPGSVSALRGADLEAAGVTGQADALGLAPGVQFNGNSPGFASLSIRGIATSNTVAQSQQPVGIYVNEVAISDPYSAVAVPDLEIFDVERLEILRGPQGTLFGSSSLAGAINYVLTAPQLDSTSGRVSAGWATVTDGDSDHAVRGMFNASLGSTAATRLVAYRRQAGGYLDNLGTGRVDANQTVVDGGRASILWQPSDVLRVQLTGLRQRTTNDDGNYADPAAGPRSRTSAFPESSRFEVDLGILDIRWRLPVAEAVSLTAYQRRRAQTRADLTPALSPLFADLVPVIAGAQPARTSGYSQEFRLVSESGARVQWLLGVFYSDVDQRLDSALSGAGSAAAIELLYGPLFGPGAGDALAPADVFDRTTIDLNATETAVFGEATLHMGSAWSVTAGGRWFRSEIDSTQAGTGLLSALTTGATVDNRIGSTRETGFNPRVALRYSPSEGANYYALVSRGFRLGNVNIVPPLPGFETPAAYDSDRLMNYEVGAKLRLADGHLRLDLAGFELEWDDIQLPLARPDGFAYTANAGRARSRGVEAALQWAVSDQWMFNATTAWIDATLREEYTTAGGVTVAPGARLPGTPRWQASSIVTWRPTAAALSPAISLIGRYVGDAPSDLEGTARQGDYATMDARVSARVGAVEISVYAANVFDRRGVTAAQLVPSPVPQTREFLVRPRTVGVGLDWSF